MEYHLPLLEMSEEQLAALLAKLKDDAGLQEKLKGAADLDAVLAIAKDAGFVISKAAWLRYQAYQTVELSDQELEAVAGGNRCIISCWDNRSYCWDQSENTR
jgi:predicted ribosomally synthesized peptide with nif11-like leader